MPGLVGFTSECAPPGEARAALSRMRELLARGESRHPDDPFCDARACATRSHTNIIQPEPQPSGEGGARVWLDGDDGARARTTNP